MATAVHDTVTQALPTPGAGPRLLHTPVHSIAPSLTNPRKSFDQAKLQELADSIKASGVHQPVLLRPLPAHRLEDTHRDARANKRPAPEFELIAGERRWRASQLAGLAEIPAMVRPMTDTEALEAQVIENLQREDVTELEEAEGYEVLMRTGNLNADQVGVKIGKSRSYVYARLKVLDLCQQGREALRAGNLDFSKALLIARIPNETLQIEALAYCTRKDYQGDLPGYRDCASHIQQAYMLRLDKATFLITDATLLDGAGSCAECPKRTGANPDLFEDVKSADVCTDPKCFHAKEEAHSARLVAEAEAKGQTVIAGKEAEELRLNHYDNKLKGYKRLDDRNDSPTDEPLRKIIGAQMVAEGIKPIKIENPRKKGEFLDALPNEVVLRLLKTVEGQAQATKEVAAEVKEFADNKKAKALEKAKAKYEQAWRDRLLDLAWQQVDGSMMIFNLEVHRYVVLREVNSLSQEDAATLADILNLGKVGAHSALIEYAKTTRAPDQLHLLVIMQRDSGANHYSHNRPKNEGLMLVAGNVFGERLPEIVSECQAHAKAEHLPKPVKAAAPKDDLPLPPAAQAIPTREGGKAKGAKGKTTPAAQARATAPKTTKAEAAAQIAAALAEAEGSQDQAPAAQGNEGAPAPAGGGAGDAAPSNSAAPVDPSVAWPFPNGWTEATATDSAAAPAGEARADAETGATVEGGEALVITSGMVLMVKDTCDAVSWRGRTVTVTGVKGASIKARESNKPPAHAERGTFFAEDLEALA